MNYREILLSKINKLINKELTVPEFEKEYYFYFLDDVPDDGLTEDELMFFGDVQEKLDWTDKDPDEVSRSYNWMNHEEYIEYVSRITKDFLDIGKYDPEKWGKIQVEILKKH